MPIDLPLPAKGYLLIIVGISSYPVLSQSTPLATSLVSSMLVLDGLSGEMKTIFPSISSSSYTISVAPKNPTPSISPDPALKSLPNTTT